MTLPQIALVRPPDRSFVTALGQKPGAPAIELARAEAQHRLYAGALRDAGLEVVVLPPGSGLPDACFVQDVALVLPEGVILAWPAEPTRQGEVSAIRSHLPVDRPWVEIHPNADERLGIQDGEIVRVRTKRAQMEVKALVVPTIRPDTIFIPYHWGHRLAANQLTNPAVDPGVKIPEYKACAATVEKVQAVSTISQNGAIENFTPANAPKMFPYANGEVKTPVAEEAKTH